MDTAIVLFTRDLRVHDNPALSAAADEAERVVPLFVREDAFPASASLEGALDDLARSLGGLTIRRGDTVAETVKLAREVDAGAVFMAEDASAFAQRRERRLRAELDLRTFPSTSIVPLDELKPYRVFTPYWRVWQRTPKRAVLGAPRLAVSAARASGGETEGRKLMRRFLDDGLDRYDEPDDLAAPATSRLGPYLHFGCISPLELAETAKAEPFVRQLCWRDFFLQLLASRPEMTHEDYKERAIDWNEDTDALDAWREGQTGYPIVDAAMRQLASEGWLHNRARLIVASFLTKTLRIHWRHGADHFARLLVDADVANNVGNWQWMAGTGTDPRPNRVLNPVRQAERHDPSGDYVRRYVPELASIPGKAVHTPWQADGRFDYPARIA